MINSNARFWTLLAVFQVAFGLAVFAATRYYYLANPAGSTTTMPAQAPWPQGAASQITPVWPTPDPNSDLQDLISSFSIDAPQGDPGVLLAKADELFENQQYAEAAQLYQQALAAGAQDAGTYNNLGITLFYLGRLEEALEAINKGIASDPTYQRIWLTLGFVSSHTGQLEQAREALNKAVQMGPDNDVGQSARKLLEGLP